MAAAWAAIVLNRVERAYNASDTLIRINERLSGNSAGKSQVYRLADERERFRTWSDQETELFESWASDLDLVAILLLADQLDERDFFTMYGDVFIRSIYALAPLVVEERENRGEQFLLPLSNLTAELLKIWGQMSKKNQYPEEIRLKFGDKRLTPGVMRDDPFVAAFIERRALP